VFCVGLPVVFLWVWMASVVVGLISLISPIIRIPHCLDNRLRNGGTFVSPTHLPHYAPQKHYFCVLVDFLYVTSNVKFVLFLIKLHTMKTQGKLEI
jgi:hypothetical protein